MGYPFTIGAVAISVLAVRRVRNTDEPDPTPADADDPAEAATRPES